MTPRSPFARFIVHLLLALGAGAFSFPLVWLVVTSLKPIEQTMSMPPTWLPRASFAEIEGKEMEVTIGYTLRAPVLIVRAADGRRDLYPPGSSLPAGSALVQTAQPGWIHVTERSERTIRAVELAWDIVPPSSVRTELHPRWENYPLALATMGGENRDGAEGALAAGGTGAGIDSQVPFSRFLLNTCIVCVLGVIGAVFSNALIAYGFARLEWPGRDLFFALTIATMMIPFPVLMVPLYGVFKSLGWIGTLKPLWAPLFFGSAFNIFLMRQFFRTIPAELSEAARIDGCSEWGIFWRVILPLSRPVLAVVALFTFLALWNDFLGPLLYLTRRHTFTLALALQAYQSQNGGVQWNLLMAASAVVTLPIIVLFFFAQKTFIRGIATSGMKG